jgi:hypothetical protein
MKRRAKWEQVQEEQRRVAVQLNRMARLKDSVSLACQGFFRKRGLPTKIHW